MYGSTRAQRCWLHKCAYASPTPNVLNKLLKHLQPKAKSDLQQIWMAETREDADHAFASFVDIYESKYPKATEGLTKDKEALLSFYDFPAEHWHSHQQPDRIDVC